MFVKVAQKTNSRQNISEVAKIVKTYEDIPALCDGLFDFSSDFSVGKLQVVACVASVVHQGEEAIIDVQKLDGKTKTNEGND